MFDYFQRKQGYWTKFNSCDSFINHSGKNLTVKNLAQFFSLQNQC